MGQNGAPTFSYVSKKGLMIKTTNKGQNRIQVDSQAAAAWSVESSWVEKAEKS